MSDAEATLKNIAEIVCSEMGCSASVVDAVDVAGADLRLPHSKLKFTVSQLKGLNTRLNSLNEDLKTQFLSEDAESIAERLVQGLVCGAAVKDSRFNSKFIVVLHKDRICKSSSLEYLVLLDDLEGSCAVAEGPPGCARLRPQEHVLHKWQDFLTPSGFLRRDKVIERWVEVLAAAAADGIIGGGLSSESTAPGYIVQPCVLQRLRSLKPEEQCFYGNATECQFPSSRDYRIAIVEGNPWVRVRLAGGALAGGAEAKLALGTAYHGWPAGSDFPSRAPLGHSDALLFYRAAQTGFFVVSGGPGSGVQWSERAAGWQVWPAGARDLLGARGEGFTRVARACMAVLDHLRATGQPPLRAVSRFMIEEALLWRAEKPTGRTPAGDLRSWTSSHLAHHILCTYDTLLGQIRARTGRHYFFQGCDMIKMAVWRAARIGERDWRGDADCLASFLKRLHDESGSKVEDSVEVFPTSQERLEMALCGRWSLLLQELTPAGSTKGRRLAGAPPYSPRQLSYVAAVARELLAARQLVIQESNDWYQGSLTATAYQRQDPIEDLIHLLAIILDQARDYFLKSNFPNSLFTKTTSKDNRTALLAKNDHSKDTLKRHKLKNCYDASSAYLLDSVRRDPETQKEDLVNDSVLVRTLLRWLYKAVDDDKKYLCPVLKPYLDLLFVTSHENCWHMEEFKSRVCEKELESLKSFCKMVGEGSVSPADGILEAATKGWSWAEKILDTLNIVSSIDSALRILFTTSNGKVLKFDLSLPKDLRERETWNTFYSSRKDGHVAKLKLAEKCVVEAFAFGLDRELYSCGTTALSSKSEEVLHGGKFDLSFGDASTTHTLRSVRSVKLGDYDNGNKYHTLRSVDSKYNTLRNSESLFGACWTSGNTLRMKSKLARPTVLGELRVADNDTNRETLDAEYSLHCHLRDFSPMNSVLASNYQLAPHREYTGVVKALITMQRYSVLQELAGWLGDGGERAGALKALHRLARGGRRASGPSMSSTLQPAFHRHNYTLSPKKSNLPHKQRASIRQYYRRRNIDALSGDESSNKKEEKAKSPDSSKDSQTSYTPSPRTREEELDLEVQKEYLENKALHDICGNTIVMNDDYLEMCREVIRESNAKLSQSSVLNLDRVESKKGRVSRKSSNRSSSVGRSGGKEVKSYLSTSTMGRNMGKDVKVSVDSLLGTCREARLQQVARKSVLPRASSAGDGLFGDAFKISPIYSGVQSEYDLMTQSILQSTGTQLAGDRQRHLAPPPRDRFYP